MGKRQRVRRTFCRVRPERGRPAERPGREDPLPGHPGDPPGLPGGGRLPSDAPGRVESGRDPGGGQGSGLPSHRLPGHGTGVPVPPGNQRRPDPGGRHPAPAAPGDHHLGNPPRGGHPVPGGDLRRGHERLLVLRPGGEPAHQPLAGRQLLWRLTTPAPAWIPVSGR